MIRRKTRTRSYWGTNKTAPRVQIKQGIDANVLPKVQMGEAVLAGVSTKDPRINDWLTLRSHCWSLCGEASTRSANLGRHRCPFIRHGYRDLRRVQQGLRR